MSQPDDRSPRALLARLGLALVWAALLFALWIALVDNTRLWENVVGIGCAIIAGAAAEAAGLFGRVRFRPRVRWLRWAIKLPWWIVVDSTVVLGAFARHVILRRPVIGATRAFRVREGGDDGVSMARRALANGVGSTGPNAYALGIDDDVLVVHELVPGRGDVPPHELMEEP